MLIEQSRIELGCLEDERVTRALPRDLLPEDAPELESEVRNAVSHAVDVSLAAPAGPVHVNVPFREPLLPIGPLTPEPVEATPTVAVRLASRWAAVDCGAMSP